MALSSRLYPLRAALGDRRKRFLHVVRHSRPDLSATARVFNLDLHISVIADVRTALESRGIGVTDWSISGHTWVFGRQRDPVAVVNERTYRRFGPDLIRRFQRVYGDYLRSYRGFVATHTPCFALLYRGLGRPTLAVCSTRYEWPFTFDRDGWAWLNDGLREGVEDGWLFLVANNRADADYVENYLGIRPHYIPSACAYVAPSYTGRNSTAVIQAKGERLARAVCDGLRYETVPLRAALGKRYTWAQLYEHRAIVLIPYNVSIMTLFEHYSACAPVYIPSRDFLKRLMADHPDEVLFQLSYAQIERRAAQAPTHGARDLSDLRDEQVLDWYLDRADFYDDEWMPRVRQFDSWPHLDHLLASDDQLAISCEMAAEKPARLTRIAGLWDDLKWTKVICG